MIELSTPDHSLLVQIYLEIPSNDCNESSVLRSAHEPTKSVNDSLIKSEGPKIPKSLCRSSQNLESDEENTTKLAAYH